MFRLLNINSIRSRMVASFMVLTGLILVQSIVSFYTLDNTTQTARIHSDINQLEIFTLNLIKCDNDFLNLEIINPNYFKTHSSIYLTRRDSLNKRIQEKLRQLTKEGKNKAYAIEANLQKVEQTIAHYNQKFKALESILFKKGFKDFGLEGQMRHYAHELEEAGSTLGIVNILNLRRHEKDFFLRHDTTYRNAFRVRVQLLLTQLRKNEKQNQQTIEHLLAYHALFLELTEYQEIIGMNNSEGLRNELNGITVSLSDQYFLLSEYSYQRSTITQYNTRLFYLSAMCIGVLISLLTGYWVSKRLSEPITRLSKLVNSSIRSKTAHKTDFNLQNSAQEIIVLTSSFVQLMNQTRDQLSEIKEKSKQLKQRNKQLRKLNKELDHFLYSTAHDLRSPLTSLSGLVHIMRLENQQPEMVHYFDRMDKSIQRQETFIAQIASFSKNKIMKVQPEKINLPTLIDELIEYHNYIPEAHRIRKEVTIANPDSIPFFSDLNRISILFNNLLSNAIRYADFSKPEPSIRIAIQIRKDKVHITFSDNGIGIAPEHVEKIFDMFYRAHADSKGSGLGLFIFSKTIKRMKGDVQVESKEGFGTTFYITLPNAQNIKRVSKQLTFADNH